MASRWVLESGSGHGKSLIQLDKTPFFAFQRPLLTLFPKENRPLAPINGLRTPGPFCGVLSGWFLAAKKQFGAKNLAFGRKLR
jgi:hypothetical protein